MLRDILLVDDDLVQGSTRQAILERAGHSVEIAGDGTSALAFLQSAAGKSLQLIVTDHFMPMMNGPEFVKLVRDAGFMLPILVLSGADVEDEYESLNVSFRIKPFPPDQLISLADYLVKDLDRRSA